MSFFRHYLGSAIFAGALGLSAILGGITPVHAQDTKQEQKAESAKDLLYSRISELEKKKDQTPEDIGALAELYYNKRKFFAPNDKNIDAFIAKNKACTDPFFILYTARLLFDAGKKEDAQKIFSALAQNESISGLVRADAYAILGDITKNIEERDGCYNSAITLDSGNTLAYCGIIKNKGRSDDTEAIFTKAEAAITGIKDPLRKAISQAAFYLESARMLYSTSKKVWLIYAQEEHGNIASLCKKSISAIPSLDAYELLLRSCDKCMSNTPDETVLKHSAELIEAAQTALKTYINNPLFFFFKAEAHYMRGEILYRERFPKDMSAQGLKESRLAIAGFKSAIQYGLAEKEKESAKDRIKTITKYLQGRR